MILIVNANKMIMLPKNVSNKQIDQFVYRLYGLTEEEIKIVEGET